MSDQTENQQSPPYISFVTFTNFLKSMKEGVIPSRIDKSVIVGQSGAAQAGILSALKFFKLIDPKGTPLPDLPPLVAKEAEEWKAVWKKVAWQAYEPVVDGLDLGHATIGQLDEKLIALGLSGETLKKCHSFFSAAMEAAGISLAPHLKMKRGGVRRTKKPRATPPANSEQNGLGSDDGHTGAGKSHNTATLLLDPTGTRSIRLTAPHTVTKSELARIQQWLSFQLIVEENP